MGLETEGLQKIPSTAPRSSNRAYVALVFLLALAVSLLSSIVPYLAVAFIYGPAVARNLPQADLNIFFWLRRSFAAEFFLVFYLLGKRLDFPGQYLQLAVLSFAGVLIGEIPQFVSIQTPSATSSVITEFGFARVTLGELIPVLYGAFQLFAILFAGLGLAFLRQGRLRATLWSTSATGERQLFSPRVLIVGFTITMAAYLASELTAVFWSTMPQSWQLAFSLDVYVFVFFYPLLFFVAFYFLGKRLDSIGGGIIAFAISSFVAGALGFLMGNDLAYYVRAFAAPSGPNYFPFPLGLPFLEDAVVEGLYVLAFAVAAASLGFVRSMKVEGEADSQARG